MDNISAKVERIFQEFDVNRDGGLNREEMTALVMAVNPTVKYTDEQIKIILDELFKIYRQFIDNDKGLSLDGLLRAYDDLAGDIDRDFDTLGLEINPTPLAAKDRTITFNYIWKLVDDLNDSIQKLNSKRAEDGKLESYNISEMGHQSPEEISDKRVLWEELDYNYAVFVKEWGVLRSRADATSSKEEAFDRHMEMAKVLYDNHLYIEAFISFQRASDLQPTHVIPRFRLGCCLYELRMHEEAKAEFLQALQAAQAGGRGWDYLLPQMHVNLGIVFQCEGMFLSACDHYREACIMCPTHFRALKLLGSALLLVGKYKAAVKALEEAVFMKSDLTDAHCDMASALLAMGDQDKAIVELERAIDLNPRHVDALFNLRGVYMDKGMYHRACETFTVLLNVLPNHWKAQLGMVVSLFGAGKSEEGKKALMKALKRVNRVELRDRIAYLKQLQKRRLKGKGSGVGEGAYIIVEPSRFKIVEETTALRRELANALDIRAFQKITRLNLCDVELIKRQINDNTVPVSYSGSASAESSIPKASLEGILHKLLGFLKPETFVAAVKAINQKIFSVLADSKSGRVDLGLFFAVVAPLCKGPPDRRKLVAYHALLCWPGNQGYTRIRKIDAQRYIKLLRAIFISSHGASEMAEITEETDTSRVTLTDFLAMFDDPDWGFGIMSTLLKLETEERNGGYVCATCRFAIIGSRFKEIKSHFSLCSRCYSEGKLPTTCQQEEDYTFREYAS